MSTMGYLRQVWYDPLIMRYARGLKQMLNPTEFPLDQPRLYSVGHSNHDLARLVQLLQGAGVTLVADVRSQPYSQRLPQFNRPELERELPCQAMAYVFLGRQLGGRPAQLQLYDHDGRVDYERVRATTAFQQGVDYLCAALGQFTVAMLCAEEDPLDCHRGLMIAPALVERGVLPAHLRGDGTIESTAELEERLLRRNGSRCRDPGWPFREHDQRQRAWRNARRGLSPSGPTQGIPAAPWRRTAFDGGERGGERSSITAPLSFGSPVLRELINR